MVKGISHIAGREAKYGRHVSGLCHHPYTGLSLEDWHLEELADHLVDSACGK